MPPSAFVKMAPAAAATRLFVNLTDLGADEIGFYRDVRPTLEIEAPLALGSAIDPASKRFVLVLEDLTARGATFGEVLQPVEVAGPRPCWTPWPRSTVRAGGRRASIVAPGPGTSGGSGPTARIRCCRW